MRIQFLRGVGYLTAATALTALAGCDAPRFGGEKQGPVTKAGAYEGQPAPEINGEDGDGHAFRLSDYRGKVVMLDFWATW